MSYFNLIKELKKIITYTNDLYATYYIKKFFYNLRNEIYVLILATNVPTYYYCENSNCVEYNYAIL